MAKLSSTRAKAIMSSGFLSAVISRGFVPDARFAHDACSDQAGCSPPLSDSVPRDDPLKDAWHSGFSEGEAQAREKFETELGALKQQYAAIDRAFTRLGEADQDLLNEKLRETVVALCEAAIEPLALDREGLARRVEKAAAMLARATDERRVRIHPEDLELVADLVDPALRLEADASLERGALRLETENGGVEDGPQVWGRAIREALGQC